MQDSHGNLVTQTKYRHAASALRNHRVHDLVHVRWQARDLVGGSAQFEDETIDVPFQVVPVWRVGGADPEQRSVQYLPVFEWYLPLFD